MTRLGKFLWDSNVMKHFLSFLVQFITFSQNYSRNFHFVNNAYKIACKN